MLIVISIISVLLGMLYGALERAQKFSRRTITYAELKSIESAFKQYYANYHDWPSNDVAETASQLSSNEDKGLVIDFHIANALQAYFVEDKYRTLNQEAIPFVEFSRFNPLSDRQFPPINPFLSHYRNTSDNKFRYKVLFDTNGDRQIQIPGSDPDAAGLPVTNIIASVAVWTIIPATRKTDGSGQPEPSGDVIFGNWDSFSVK